MQLSPAPANNWQIKAILPVFLLSGCSLFSAEPAWKAAVAGDGPGNPQLVDTARVEVKNLPKSARGNASSYSVFDVTYQVMDSARGFNEWGEASWYGKKFHGRQTANGDVYDMHQLTAAHKHLPLPTFVRVTRVDNDESVVVKVNDRGPFVDDRIIDLSYAAAAQLGMLDGGKADVYIEALSDHEAAPAPATATQIASASVNGNAVTESDQQTYLQVGAYSQIPNAERMVRSLSQFMEAPVGINHDRARSLFRVRIGPLVDDAMLGEVKKSLALAGIENYTVVSATP